MIHHISAEYLTVDRVREILENNIKIDLSEDAKKRIVRCREYLDNKMETQKEPIYGITTGFGSLCNISIDKDQLSQLQKNLVMSHACGTGERVPAEIVKLMLLLKIQSLSYERDWILSSSISFTISAGTRSPVPQACDITRFFCNCESWSLSIEILQSEPKPVVIP